MMTMAQRRSARGNSSQAVGRTAYAKRRKVPRVDVDEQELLPGIPNHVTVENIASKLDWKTCNVLQSVSRGWHRAVYSRDVYDAKVLSKSTKAFFVVLSYEEQALVRKLVLTLYSCSDNYSLRLPPIPPIPPVKVDPHYIDCLCVEGRVYLWIRQKRAERVRLYVLDLAGHRKWEKRKPVNCTHYYHELGVLDGKIYKFQTPSYGVLTSDDPVQRHGMSIQGKVRRLPITEIYNPTHDVWSLITPTLGIFCERNINLSDVDLEHHLALFSDWAEKKMAADPSKTFLTNGRYESYFSEWKQKQSYEYSTTSTVEKDSGNGMATQVYCSLPSLTLSTVENGLQSTEVLFLGGKLVTYKRCVSFNNRIGGEINIRGYDAQTNIWRHWKSVSVNFQPLKEGHTFSINKFDGFAAANNSLWAIVATNEGQQSVTYFLVKSPELIDDDNIKSLTWIDTGFQACASRYFAEGNALKPIYL